jgi:hypothetical protein
MNLVPALALFLACSAAAQTPFSTPMRDVENPDRFLYQERANLQIEPGLVNNFVTFPTAGGRRTIIEFVAVSCRTPSVNDSFPQVLLGGLRITGAATSQAFDVPVVELKRGNAPFSGYVWTGSARVKMFSDSLPLGQDPTGGSALNINIYRTDTTVRVFCTATISGYTAAL